MDFAEVVRHRHMTRSFEHRPIPREILWRVLRAGLHAPSAGFTQGSSFLVLEGHQTELFWNLTTRNGPPRPGTRHARMRTAPVVIVALANRQAYLDRYAEPDKAGLGLDVAQNWPVPYWEVDTAFGTMSMLLAATNEGLGALFFGIFAGADTVLHTLGVPDGLAPIGAIALGFAAPDDIPSPSLARGRKDPAELVHWGTWGSLA